MSTTRRDSVQSVERAFDLIEALADGAELGVTELAERTGLVPSTAHRLLATLTKRGYISHSSASSRYGLGYKVLELATDVEQSLARLRRIARPHLNSIREATGESANLTVLNGDLVVYVDQAEGTRNVRMFTTVGATALAHTTASGKAMLAYRPPEAINSLYPDGKELARLTPRTLATVAELREDLAKIERRGYAIDNEEHEEGSSCVAAPVLDHRGRPCGALSVSGPTARIVGDTGDTGELLRSHAQQVSAALGHGGDRIPTGGEESSRNGEKRRMFPVTE